MKNIAIQTDDEFICFYTTSIERAQEVAKHAGVIVTDMYEVRDDEMEHYYFDSRLWDTEKELDWSKV